MAIFHPEHFEVCSNESALVTPIYDISRKRYVLFINNTLGSLSPNSSEVEYNCYYQEITRDKSHDSYDKVDRKYFSQNYEVPLHVQGLILACHRLGNESDILQSDAYTLIQYKPLPKGLSQEPARRKPSVLMFGIDSLSRINLRRTMPKVYNFLTGSGWYELQGYNKIGDNTFPNLMAILTGYNPNSALKKVCDWHERGCLDQTPFIWKYFRNASYLTAYAEDETGMSTFNYVKPGFVESPTDFYLRPFQKAFESDLNTWKCKDCSMRYCIGRRITSSYVYDMARDFARRFVDERPIWGLFWSNSFSHDSYQMPSKMEDYVLQYLLDFQADGVFEQSIMVFLSDHGSRWGKIVSLPSGFLEEYLAGRNLSGICSELTLSYVHETEMKIGLDQNFNEDLALVEVATYRTMFKVKQNSADFRATVHFNNVTESVEVSVPTISRLDSYKDVSNCVDDKTDKMYCICKSDLKDKSS
uniref:Uncharacterized protein LOC108052502 n=1 Tax=Drosophila rhopaloa TaxID=1041015 RepID=A0A6P4FIR0_DRORH